VLYGHIAAVTQNLRIGYGVRRHALDELLGKHVIPEFDE
jgi:hypothetical protein